MVHVVGGTVPRESAQVELATHRFAEVLHADRTLAQHGTPGEAKVPKQEVRRLGRTGVGSREYLRMIDDQAFPAGGRVAGKPDERGQAALVNGEVGGPRPHHVSRVPAWRESASITA